MTAIKTSLADRAKLWAPGQPLPQPGRAFGIGKDRLGFTDPGSTRLSVDEAAMSATFVITSRVPDRVGDVIEPKGISLTNFAKNPVGFFGHQQLPLPIGKWEDRSGKLTIQIRETDAVGTLFFSQRYPDAAQVFALVAEDILRATSIGFNPLVDPVRRGDSEPNPNSLFSGFLFPGIDLLEISVVGVPCHPLATRVAEVLSRRMIGGEKLTPFICKALQPLAEPRKAWSTGFTTKGKRTMSNKKGVSENSGAEGGYSVPEGMSLLRVRCMKDAYPDKPDAEAKVSGLGYVVDDYEETDDSHDFHQERADALDGDPGEDEIENGIRAVVGKRKADAADEDDLESQEPPDRKPDADDAAKRGRPAKRKQDALPADGGAGLETEEVEGDAPVDLPQGAAVAQSVIEYVQGQLPKLEPEVREVFEDVTETLIEWAQDRYPDVEFGAAEAEEALAPEAAVEAEEQITDELMDRYRQGQVGRAKLLAHVLRKRMSKRHQAVVRDAADHLEDMADIEAGSPFTRTHKVACKAHHAAVRALLRDLDTGLEDDEEGGDDKAADLDVAAITKKLERLEERRSTLDQAFYRLTGKRAE